jgi:hypothetical protein
MKEFDFQELYSVIHKIILRAERRFIKEEGGVVEKRRMRS